MELASSFARNAGAEWMEMQVKGEDPIHFLEGESYAGYRRIL